VYVSQKFDGDLQTRREHIPCNERARKMCSGCIDSQVCCSDIGECYREEKEAEKENAK